MFASNFQCYTQKNESLDEKIRFLNKKIIFDSNFQCFTQKNESLDEKIWSSVTFFEILDHFQPPNPKSGGNPPKSGVRTPKMGPEPQKWWFLTPKTGGTPQKWGVPPKMGGRNKMTFFRGRISRFFFENLIIKNNGFLSGPIQIMQRTKGYPQEIGPIFAKF